MKKRLVQRVLALAMAAVLITGEGSIAMAAQTEGDALVLEAVEETAETSPSEELPSQALPSEEGEAVEEASEEVPASGELSSGELSSEETSQEEEVALESEEAGSEAVEEEAVGETVSEEAEKTTEEAGTDEAGEEITKESVSEETAQETSEETTELTTEEETQVSETEEGEVEKEESIFPGLKEGFTLTAAQKADKAELRGYTSDISKMTEGTDYVPGQIMVEAETKELAEEYAKAFGGTLKDYFLGTALIELNEVETDTGVRAASVAEAVLLSASESVLLPAAWPNYYRYAFSNVQDPMLAENHVGYQWHHNVVGSKEAWAAGYTGKGVTVAVLDTGIRSTHEDISVAKALYATGTTVTITDGNDVQGHGTHVAGIIGAERNGVGGVGIAYDAELISIKVLGDNGAGDAGSTLKGLELAINNNADIVNMSLGGHGYNGAEQEAYVKAYEKGIAIICAAGNETAHTEAYPAAYNGTIAVAAVDKNSHKASFSNYGSWVDYSAPGVEVFSTYTQTDKAYTNMSGTSQATPIVSGVAALLWDKAGGEGKTKVENLKKLINKSCVKANGSGIGKGVVNLSKALGLDSVLKAPSKPVFSIKGGTYTYNTVDEAKALQVELSAPEGYSIYYTVNGKGISYKNGKLSEGAIRYKDPIEVIEVCDAKGKAAIKAIAVNEANQLASSAASATYTFKIKYPDSVYITSAAVGNNVVAKGKSLKLTATLEPAYVTDKSLKWEVLDNPAGISVVKGTVKVTAQATPGEYTIRATAAAAEGRSAATDVYNIQVVEVAANPITSIKVEPKAVTVKAGDEAGTDATVTVTRKDKSLATANEVSWISADSSIARVEVKNDTTITIKGRQAGKTKITGIAEDGSGKKVTFNVTVIQPVTRIVIGPVTGVDEVAVGKTLQLIATVRPSTATNKKVTWSMEEDPYVSIHKTSGKVSVKAGAAEKAYTVTATAADGSGVSATYQFTVKNGMVTGISLKKDGADFKNIEIFRAANKFGAPTEASIEVMVEGGNPAAWTATSSNENLVRVGGSRKDNRITVEATGRATGTATITVISTDGTNIKKSFKVTVNNPATALHVAPEKGRVNVLAHKKNLKLSAVLENSLGTINSKAKKLQWESSNPSWATVDKNGKVTALEYSKWVEDPATGMRTVEEKKVTITARTTDGSNLEASYEVMLTGEITKLDVPALNTAKNVILYINVGDSYCLPVTATAKTKDGAFMMYGVIECKVNKGGLSAYYGVSEGAEGLFLYANKKDTYKITLSCLDGSSAKKTYTLMVK